MLPPGTRFSKAQLLRCKAPNLNPVTAGLPGDDPGHPGVSLKKLDDD
jgi:hypothetical protein